MSQRKGEDDRTHFRTDRIVQINNQWYFMTRESGDPLGPFDSYDRTVREAKHYLKDLEKYADPTLLYIPIRSQKIR